jgi:hypothetical protein
MPPKNRHSLIFATLIAVIVGSILLLALPALVQAGPDLPPRNPPGKPQADDDDGDKPVGAYIILEAPAGAWAGVQWQDSAGGWHEVEGWQGRLSSGRQQWWVAAKDFGTGSFRWMVTAGPGGAMVGVSSPFNLPTAANETVTVNVPGS